MQTADLRKFSPTELETSGRQSLHDHLIAQAVVAHQKHGPLTGESLDAFLMDSACVRHPVRLAFELGEMALHQFAQPGLDWRNTEKDGRVLYLRPQLKKQPDLIRLAVAYMVPLINYGPIVTDEQCLAYGATLLGMMEEEYYARICALGDSVGATTRRVGQPEPQHASCC